MAVDLDPKNVKAYWRGANAYYKEKRYEEAHFLMKKGIADAGMRVDKGEIG